LPKATAQATLASAASPDSSVARSDADPAEADLSGVRILIVDDEPDAREVIAEMLRRAAAHTMCAASAAEALATLQESPPDILVSDIAMPDQDGYQLINRVRQLPKSAGGQVPAVALTAHAREEDRARALAAGFDAHLAKPVNPRELMNLLTRLCPSNPRIIKALKHDRAAAGVG
jgi:CheY-like chemotaxis protein